MYQDLFVDGPDDMAILQSTYLTDFYKNGFNTIEQNAVMKERAPDRIILNGAFDPRDGEKGLDAYRPWRRSTSSRASSCTPPNGRARAAATS